jgi:hypothetical protein
VIFIQHIPKKIQKILVDYYAWGAKNKLFFGVYLNKQKNKEKNMKNYTKR